MEKFYGRPLPTVYISNTQMYSSDVHELEMQFEDYFWKLKANLDFEIISNLSSNWISITRTVFFISFFYILVDLKIVKSLDWSNLTNVTKDSLGQIAP